MPVAPVSITCHEPLPYATFVLMESQFNRLLEACTTFVVPAVPAKLVVGGWPFVATELRGNDIQSTVATALAQE